MSRFCTGFCFDSSEKRRVPSWTDRILYRVKKHDNFVSEIECDVNHIDVASRNTRNVQPESPISCFDVIEVLYNDVQDPKMRSPRGSDDGFSGHEEFSPSSEKNREKEYDIIQVDVLEYTSRGDVISSDHKPVVSVFNVALKQINFEKLRQIYCQMSLKVFPKGDINSESLIMVNTNQVHLRPEMLSQLDITNTGKSNLQLSFSFLSRFLNINMRDCFSQYPTLMHSILILSPSVTAGGGSCVFSIHIANTITGSGIPRTFFLLVFAIDVRPDLD